MAPKATPPNPANLVQLSAKFPIEIVEDLRRLGADGSMSEALRTAATFGLMALRDPDALAALDLSHQVNEARRWSLQHGPRITPSGSHWAPGPDQMPEPGTIPSPAVIATPAGVIATGAGETGALTVDMEHGAVTISSRHGDRWTVPLDLATLASLAATLAAALGTLAAGPGVLHLVAGLRLQRHHTGMVSIQGGSQSVLMDSLTAFRLSAEVSCLLCSQIAPRLLERERLEDLMKAPAAEVQR